MPCQSYDSSWDSGSDDRKIRELKKQADKLARIACKALATLEENQLEDLLLLKDDETREWWAKHKEDDRKAQEAKEARERRERTKAEALSKLSAEEKEVLGLTAKTAAAKKKTQVWDIESDYSAKDVIVAVEELEEQLDELAKIWVKRK